MTIKCLRVLVVVAIVVLAVPAHVRAQMADTVILRSGNLVIGEVQTLNRGDLSFDTDEMDVVEIDWEEIALITSGQFFEVLLVSGEEFFGSLASADTGMLVIVGAMRADTVPFPEVVGIRTIERRFWARTNGFVDLGADLAKANRLRSLLVKARFNYAGQEWGLELSGESYWQRQQSVSAEGDTTTQRTSRNKYSLAGSRFLGARWAITGSGQGEQDEEFFLDLRFLGVVTGSFWIVRNRGVELSVSAGAVLNKEQYVDEDPATSGEIQLGSVLDAFDVGDIDIYTALTTYVNPADDGRLRLHFDARIAWEIISDFTVGLNVTERFDSKPGSETAGKRNYQYTFSIGWSWN